MPATRRAGQCDLVKKMALTDVNGTTCSVIVWTDVAAHMFVKAEQPTACTRGSRPSTTSGTTSSADAGVTRPASGWLEAVKGAERRGELLTAFDLAEQGLAEHPGRPLAEAPRGARARARGRHGRGGAAVRALRIAGGRAGRGHRGARRAHLQGPRAGRPVRRQARAGAARPRSATRRSTPARAATTPRSTRPRSASSPASRRRRASSHAPPSTRRAAAKRARTTRPPPRRKPISCSATSPPRRWRSNAPPTSTATTTRRSRRRAGNCAWCARSPGSDPEILAHPRRPRGRALLRASDRRSGRGRAIPGRGRGEVAEGIEAELASNTPRYAYGSLASGADILWAEALLAHGAELHVVLPFARDAFIESSVASSGPGWVERFHRCLGAAFSVIYATENAFVRRRRPLPLRQRAGDGPRPAARALSGCGRPSARGLGRRDGSRRGRNRARHRHLARHGTGVSVIAPGPRRRAGRRAAAPNASGRVVRAMLFADVKGFSKLADEQVPRVLQHVLGAFAAVLERYADAIEHQNTWGDALYVVLTDPVQAAECALELQGADGRRSTSARSGCRRPARPAHRRPRWPGVPARGARCCAHARSPGRTSAAPRGSSRSRRPARCTSRSRLRRPWSSLWHRTLGCDYVGTMPAAKDYGRFRMYRLRRRSARGG